ncbi:1-deoxy-D-xylulose-5-phosphate synthase [bacterium]|nr:1-deoxy-D-xylulose-5-phosphate synthase [bacterium]
MIETATKVIDKVNSPDDVKKLSLEEMYTLADEMREAIIKKVNTTGGHFGPNLGIVEATIALHYVFNSPVDKIVFDVSHQCYPHKMLTGRKEGFLNPDLYLKYTGYTAPEETDHDVFKVGHTSTSVSLATGLAKGRDLIGGKENIIALIGDGSLTGGEALEGLNIGATLGSNLIVIVNDNDQSIAPNQGGICEHLTKLRNTNGECKDNIFKAFGYEYYYIDEGHDIQKLIDLFSKVKDTDHPVVIHMHTIKGKGFEPAETNREPFHWILPNALDKLNDEKEPYVDYGTLTADYIEQKVNEGVPIVAMSPATPAVSGFFPPFRERIGNHYIDVGIAEQHAVGMASGIAKRGGKPILAVMSSFIQRAYDQLSQDLALNNTPATILIFWGGITNADATHLTTFDIPLISNIPNIVYLCPTNKSEYLRMLDWSVSQNEHPVVIRVPMVGLDDETIDTTDYSKINKFKLVERGEKVAILGLGNSFELAKKVRSKLNDNGINPTIINPIYATGLDKELLESLKQNHKLVITIEDGEIDGGFGEKVTRFYGVSDMKVLNYGSFKEFTDRVPMNELEKRYHLTPELILGDIIKAIG